MNSLTIDLIRKSTYVLSLGVGIILISELYQLGITELVSISISLALIIAIMDLSIRYIMAQYSTNSLPWGFTLSKKYFNPLLAFALGNFAISLVYIILSYLSALDVIEYTASVALTVSALIIFNLINSLARENSHLASIKQ